MGLRNASSEPASLLDTMLHRMGSTWDDVEDRSFGPQTHQGPMVISGDPMEDTLGSRRVTVESVRQLKALVGLPDEHVRAMSGAGDTVRYPEAPPIDASAAIDRARDSGQPLDKLIHSADRDTIDLALHAYVMGDSDRVRLHEPLIDALRFPADLVVATARDITVTAENPLIIGPDSPYAQKDPTLGAVAAFGTVTVKSGGVIEISIPVNITADRFIFEGPKPGVIKLVGIDGTPGRDGDPGQDGAKGADATGGRSIDEILGFHTTPFCIDQPTPGGRGGSGGDGHRGASGGDGDCRASWVGIMAGELSGRILVQLVGGNGGKGGNGGRGGNGGVGGAGASVDPVCSNTINPKTQTVFGKTMPSGPRGYAGMGGEGGWGGSAARVAPHITVLYTSLAPDSEWTFDAEKFGRPGMGGMGGIPGDGPYNGPARNSDGHTGTDMLHAPILIVRQGPSSL